MKDRKLVDVSANAGWQDSGIVLQKGMPVHIEVRGTWKVVLETDAAGFVIPEKMRPRASRIHLGSLVGVIASSPSELEKMKPFLIKPGQDFVAKESGRLSMRMFDIQPADNEGALKVLVQNTFGK